MSCSACEKRRESAKRFAVNILKSIVPASHVNSKVQETNNVQTACRNCTTKVTVNGWVNVCSICQAESVAKPVPHKEKPKCNC
jgi:hypothetical protein